MHLSCIIGNLSNPMLNGYLHFSVLVRVSNLTNRFRRLGRQNFNLHHKVQQPLFIDFLVIFNFFLQLVHILFVLVRLVAHFLHHIITFFYHRLQV